MFWEKKKPIKESIMSLDHSSWLLTRTLWHFDLGGLTVHSDHYQHSCHTGISEFHQHVLLNHLKNVNSKFLSHLLTCFSISYWLGYSNLYLMLTRYLKDYKRTRKTFWHILVCILSICSEYEFCMRSRECIVNWIIQGLQKTNITGRQTLWGII